MFMAVGKKILWSSGLKKLRPKADYVDSQLEYEQAYATIRDDGWYPR